MSEARLPLAYRDSCANLLIPLNQCRVKEYYLPWKCEVRRQRNPPTHTKPNLALQSERHSYEKCQYDEFKKRVAKMDELKKQEGYVRHN